MVVLDQENNGKGDSSPYLLLKGGEKQKETENKLVG